MKEITYGDAVFLRPNRTLQDIYADGTLIGYVVTLDRGLLSPILEAHWSEPFTEEELGRFRKEVSRYTVNETEDEGFFQFGYTVNNDDHTETEMESRLQAFASLVLRLLASRNESNNSND